LLRFSIIKAAVEEDGKKEPSLTITEPSSWMAAAKDSQQLEMFRFSTHQDSSLGIVLR
jgi:hypothetical protein